MEWIKIDISETKSGLARQALAFTDKERDVIRTAIKKALPSMIKKLNRLEDIHESGEATELQENKRMILEDEIEILKCF